MTDIPDREVLAEFARSESEPAFAELVRRHIALVHSVALRHTDNPQHAQEITQAVFIILARKAASLGRGTVLSGWLYHTARLTAANFRRAEFRRIRREQEAFMQSTIEENSPDAAWQELAPLLDDAMAHLGATDRDAVVLRYFENKSLSEVGVALGMEERAAQKRVSRALEKLRRIFTKRGVSLTTTVIAGAVAANSVQAAPVGLAITVAATAAKGSAVAASTLTLIKGALKIMAWTKAKTAVVAGVVLILAAGTATVITKKVARTGADALALKNLPTMDNQLQRARMIVCVNNMKQMSLAVRVWSLDNKDIFPPDIVSMSNELSTPKILICPADVGNLAARDFSSYSDDNCSYKYLASLANDSEPNRVLFFCPFHGTIALCDGSVQAGVARDHPNWLVKRGENFYYEPRQ